MFGLTSVDETKFDRKGEGGVKMVKIWTGEHRQIQELRSMSIKCM